MGEHHSQIEMKHKMWSCVSGKENRTDSGICNSLGWQSHFVREGFEPMETFLTRIGGCGREEFSERVVGQVG